MAYCETKNQLNQESGAWAAMKLAAHAKRCLLCKLIKAEEEGGITPELINKYQLRVISLPKNAWSGQSAQKVVEYENQRLLLHD